MAGKLLTLFTCLLAPVFGAIILDGDAKIVTTRNVNEAKSYIDLKIVSKPHHLFIGRCNPNHDLLHSENIILRNDGRSHANATIIRFNIEADVNITCVKVLDNMGEDEGEGAYPSFIEGGLGHNYVVIGISAKYGRGYKFYVEIYGLPINKKNEEDKQENITVAPYRRKSLRRRMK